MSRKPHQIAQNDVRFSALPLHADRPADAFCTERTSTKRLARPRHPKAGYPEAELPAEALAVGLCRTRGAAECPDDVRVLSKGCSFFITEAEYQRRECRPLFDDLPWHVDGNGKLAGEER